MALLWFSDFDEPVASASWQASQPHWNNLVNNANNYPATSGEFGTRCAQWGDSPSGSTASPVTVSAPAYSGSIIFGYRWAIWNEGSFFASPSQNYVHLAVTTTTGTALTVVRLSTGSIVVRDSSDSDVGFFQMPIQQWNTIELKISPGGIGVGSCSFYFNGFQVFSDSTTYNWGSGTVTGLDLGGQDQYDIDDQRCDRFWWLDTSGSAPFNDIIGGSGIRAAYVLPNANGNSSDWVGSDGNSTDNYLLVDESTLNTAEYVQAGTLADTDLYGYAALSGVDGGIEAVQVMPYLSLPDGGSRYVRAKTRISATNYDGTSQIVQDGQYAQLTFLQNPNTTSAWTVSDVDGAEFGIEVRDS